MSLADHYRGHAAAFRLALKLQITPREAEEKLRHEAAMDQHREAARRLAAKMSAPLPRYSDQLEPDEHPLPFWQRD